MTPVADPAPEPRYWYPIPADTAARLIVEHTVVRLDLPDASVWEPGEWALVLATGKRLSCEGSQWYTAELLPT